MTDPKAIWLKSGADLDGDPIWLRVWMSVGETAVSFVTTNSWFIGPLFLTLTIH